MERLYSVEEERMKEVKFKYQKKCDLCKETFCCENGNRDYCNKCQERLNLPVSKSEEKEDV